MDTDTGDHADATLHEIREELARVQEELDIANEEKTKAAEYGLLALEEKQQLQDQFDELEAAHSATRNELDRTLTLLDDLQRERSQREQQEENLRSSLLLESERRESQLVDSNSELQDLVNKLRQSLRTESERRQHAEAEAKQLQEAENDRMLFKQNGVDRTAELERRFQKAESEAEILRERVASLEHVQAKAETLEETLRVQEVEHDRLSDHVNHLTDELAQAQVDASQAYTSLKEEQEKCHHLEMKLEEMEVTAMGGGSGLDPSEASMLSELSHSAMVTPPLVDHANKTSNSMVLSPPSGQGHNESLMSELQVTLGSEHQERIQDLEELLEERNSTILELNKQLHALKEEVTAFKELRNSHEASQAKVKELESEVQVLQSGISINGETVKISAVEEMVKSLQASVRQLTEELQAKESQLDQSTEVVNGEHAALVKKLESLEAERSTLLLDAEERSEKLRIELFGIREENEKLTARKDELEQRLADSDSRFRTSEDALAEQRDLLATVTRDAQNLLTDVEGMARLAASLTAKRERGDDTNHQPVSVDASSSQALDAKQLLIALRDNVRVVKSSVESVLRSSLERHAVTSPSKSTSGDVSSRAADSGWSEDNKRHAQMRIEKLKRELKTRTNEVSTLRTVMLANRSTAQAALQREKAAAERKIREAEDRVVRARADVEKIQRDNSQMATMRSMFSERCEEYIRQVMNFKRTVKELTEEKKELSTLLERAIAQKVRLTERLEEYEIENERAWSIPQALQATKV